MNLRFLFLLALCCGAARPTAQAQHFDIQPKTVAAKIGVDAYDDSTSMTVASDVTAFGYDFQEDPADPYFASDPGFNALAGGLPPGSSFGFGILSDLLYWNGTGPVSFGAVPDGESLTLTFGANSRTAGTGSGAQAGFFFGGAVTASGSFHKHLSSILNGGAGAADPLVGIYALRIDLTSSVLANSDPLWLVYNNGLGEEVHDRAVDYLAGAVPEPSALALALLAAIGLAAAGCRTARPSG